MNSKEYCVEPNQSNQKSLLACGAEAPKTACDVASQQCATATPRLGNSAFAQQATGRIYDTWNYAVEEELIRARDMGRAEGRAEFALARKQYEDQIASLKEKNAWQAGQLDRMARTQSASRIKGVWQQHSNGCVMLLPITRIYSYSDGHVVYVGK